MTPDAQDVTTLHGAQFKRDVIAAIQRCHLKANIAEHEIDPRLTVQWDQARIDAGGSLFGPGPYLHVPIQWNTHELFCTVRVYPPARLRRRLRRALGWAP